MHAGRYGQQAGGTHPTGMHSCFTGVCDRSCRWDTTFAIYFPPANEVPGRYFFHSHLSFCFEEGGPGGRYITCIITPTNEAWEKVIFSQVCVIPSVQGEVGEGWLPSMHWEGGVCIQEEGGLHLGGRGSASRGSASGLGGSASSGMGVCIQG